MNRKDFTTLADAVVDILETRAFSAEQKELLLKNLVNKIKADNASFNEEKFLTYINKRVTGYKNQDFSHVAAEIYGKNKNTPQ